MKFEKERRKDTVDHEYCVRELSEDTINHGYCVQEHSKDTRSHRYCFRDLIMFRRVCILPAPHTPDSLKSSEGV
ncbi:hypothetical protein RRG08_048686 [Elysia crispata]|uniref:Uncharacterized protein n=1 Tax=Elysia crispata TaxID=231223 RepID=A0AAE1B748_9GAST|nr:hypothetical protein RRG08_048686 [Elysia crispata]